jgi:ABC-type uncharacterized transport system involved in gliding motility auxiliary subunit
MKVSRQAQYGGYLSIYLLVFLAILVAGNYLAQRYNKTYDATTQKLFSLSDQSKKIVSGLKNDVKMYYFDETARFNESRFGPSPRDQLTRYSNLSPKVAVEYIDPRKNPKRAQEMGVTQMGSLFIEAGGRREESKGITEEQVTNALIRALKPEKRTACFLTGHGEHDIENTRGDGFSAVKEALEGSNYITRAISLLEKETPKETPKTLPAPGEQPPATAAPAAAAPLEVPLACSVLLVAGPRTELLAQETDALRKYVQNHGGRLLVLVNPLTKGVATKTLEGLLEEWGVKAENDLVVDLSGVGQLFGADEFSPLVSKYESHTITSEMRNTASLFPLARTINTGAVKEKVSVQKLFTTSSRSYGLKEFNQSPIKLDEKRDSKGPLSLAVAGTYGAGAGSGVPNGGGRFVVVGSSRFVGNAALGFPGGNKDLFLNMMNWLSSDEDLISIRPKEVEDRRLTLTAAQMSRILYANVFGLPLLIIGAGTWVWWRRR